MSNTIEEMGDFFDTRANIYEDHMMSNVENIVEYYTEISKYIPRNRNLKLLDLGCGTGLELDEILKVNSDIEFTGIDLSSKMLEKLMEKHRSKREHIKLINASYFDVDYGKSAYDVAISSMTFHHFSHEEKLELYKKIYDSLVDGGRYVEADYIAKDQEFEDFRYSELKRIKAEMNITDGFYHYDTPCTAENIIRLMKKAGFSEVELKWKKESAAVISFKIIACVIIKTFR